MITEDEKKEYERITKKLWSKSSGTGTFEPTLTDSVIRQYVEWGGLHDLEDVVNFVGENNCWTNGYDDVFIRIKYFNREYGIMLLNIGDWVYRTEDLEHIIVLSDEGMKRMLLWQSATYAREDYVENFKEDKDE